MHQFTYLPNGFIRARHMASGLCALLTCDGAYRSGDLPRNDRARNDQFAAWAKRVGLGA